MIVLFTMFKTNQQNVTVYQELKKPSADMNLKPFVSVIIELYNEFQGFGGLAFTLFGGDNVYIYVDVYLC